MGLLLLLLLGLGIVLFLRRQDGDVGRLLSGSPGKRPIDIAKERYARGEITREQYEQMRLDLGE
ncbi:MAG TPA: SHOCT domain-containing protein [bacterium]|nr:SHOCT domain-containing protein [bacterium]